MPTSKKLLWGVLMLVLPLGGAAFPTGAPTQDQDKSVSLPMEMVADYLHAVIEANREVYTKHVVDRLQAKGVAVASENWEFQNTMPLPAQLLMESDRVLERNGSGIQYRLISSWPINKRNVASGEFQKNGLVAILAHPSKPYTGYVTVGIARYFQAVYPDLAMTEGCIGCPNAHPESAKRDFKINDVMGAMVISIPVK